MHQKVSAAVRNERIGVRINPDQRREVSALATERGENFSVALRLVLKLGLEQLKAMAPKDRAVA